MRKIVDCVFKKEAKGKQDIFAKTANPTYVTHVQCKDSHKKFQDLRNHIIVPSKTQQHDDSSGPSDFTTPFRV